MTKLLSCLTICAVLHSGRGISTKVDFDDESPTTTVTNSSIVEDDDVEVKHTIVVSTKLRNSNGNRRGLHGNDGDSGILSYNVGRKENPKRDDSGEVPVVQGYKAVETTQIRTPDTRFKQPAALYPDSVFISRNIRDDYDVYPNLATNPTQWKPSSFFNNINYWNQDHGTDSNFLRRLDRPSYQNPRKIHRKVTDDGMKEFYCRKCRELNGVRGCPQSQQRSWVETTTAKMKIDGKLAKLN